MKTVLDILRRDLLALVKNPIALLVVGALMVLPGLYAWYCIYANWDPYANTGNMPIAVVNHDKGAKSELAGSVNVGEQVVANLRDNDSIDWQFFDDTEEALEQTRIGKIYATIELPEDLSENLLGIFEGSDERPTICYYPNEKYSAVATKVTDSAAQTLVRQINRNFSSTVNEKILVSTQGVVEKAEEHADQTSRSAAEEIKAIQAGLEKVAASLDDVSSSIERWREAARNASSALSSANDQLPIAQSLLANASTELNSLNTKMTDFESKLSGTILSSSATASNVAGQASSTLIQTTKDLEEVRVRLKELSGTVADDPLLAASLVPIQALIDTIDGVVSGVSTNVSDLNTTVQEIASTASSATNRISNEVIPQLSAGTVGLSSSTSKLSGVIGQIQPQIATLLNVLSQTDAALETATYSIADAKTLLTTMSGNLKGTMADIGTIGNALQVDRLTDILNIDPENVSTFVSSPVEMVTEKIYPVSNYGTAVAPFYTNLALWIGCFILVSLMKVEVNAAGFEESTSRQRYFGRWLLFVILSLIQSQVICGVDIILGIDCHNPALFMLAGAVCSFAYMNLIFALVKTFRNIGKTLCILLLIMQVPGSSGMYPIQMMPAFFQSIHPILPFTYGINAMREALCGMYGLSYLCDILFLLLIVVSISMFIGLLLRPIMSNLLLMFDEEVRKVGFFASEEHAQGVRGRVRSVVRAMVMNGLYADDIEVRAWRFSHLYPKLRKAGTIALFAIPAALLVLMVPFNITLNVSVDARIGALVIMVIVLIIVALSLIALEYAHRLVLEETRMLGASIMGDDWGFDVDELGGSDDAPASEGMLPATDKLRSRPKFENPASDIFFTDLQLGFQSSVGVVVIILLVITPSMYAWFNIAGSWDPYGSTGNLKVAVANEDEGYKGDLLPITVNIGDTVISQLHGNSGFDWVFVDKERALEGVKSSEYYAAIEIPRDFSRNMMTYLVDDADYPDVLYYTNQKENPIAPIITQKGADSIQESIRVGFTELVDQVVLGIVYEALTYITNPSVGNYVSTMSKHFDDATNDAKSAARQLTTLSGLALTISGIVSTTDSAIDGLKAASTSASSALDDAKSGITGADTAFSQATSIVQDVLNRNDFDLSRMQEIINTAIDLLGYGSEVTPSGVQGIIDIVNGLRPENPSPAQAAKFDAVIESLQTAKGHADALPGNVAQARADIDSLIADATAGSSEIKAYFNNDVVPSLNSLRATMESITASASEIVGSLHNAISGVGGNAGDLSNQLTSLSESLLQAGDRLDASASKIEAAKKRVAEALSSGDMQKIKNVILGNDPEALAANLAAPVVQQREAMYPISNYGSAMAPFYTVLSLWVGALVMISTMRVHVVEDRLEELRQRYGNVRPRHEFFGRYGIFGFISLLQSTLVLLGDLLFLNIQCVSPLLFFLFGIFIGQIFCLIVYTITELFGDVGKALCVILLIMQVAASGGTFPVEMLGSLLLDIAPLLPFYHAMTLLQECVAGIVWINTAITMAALVVMAVAMLIIGLPLRRPFRKLNDFFEGQLEKTGYM